MSPDRVLSWLAASGASFVLLRPHDKRPCHKGWVEQPVGLTVAEEHVARGGNVGILVGPPSRGIVCLDADLDFPLIHQLLPVLGGACVMRSNAPQRGKFLLRLATSTRNRSWRPRASRRPGLELLATRKVAVVPPSIHPSGVPYVLHGDQIPLFDNHSLECIWEVLTAASLEVPSSPPPKGNYAVGKALSVTWKRGAISQVKQRWPSALAVFRHFGVTGRMWSEGRYDLRIGGHGGLLVGRPDSAYAWRWYCFSDEMGGDQVDAAGHCLFGRGWDRYDASLFHSVLRALAAN